MEPRGATEIQHELLEKHVSKDLLDKVQICTSIPGKVPLDPKKINILWQKNSYDQGNLQEFFLNKDICRAPAGALQISIGMFLTHIGIMKSLGTFFKYQRISVL